MLCKITSVILTGPAGNSFAYPYRQWKISPLLLPPNSLLLGEHHINFPRAAVWYLSQQIVSAQLRKNNFMITALLISQNIFWVNIHRYTPETHTFFYIQAPSEKLLVGLRGNLIGILSIYPWVSILQEHILMGDQVATGCLVFLPSKTGECWLGHGMVAVMTYSYCWRTPMIRTHDQS